MSFLSTLLNEPEPKTASRIKRLEQSSAEQSIDVSYISALKQSSITAMRELGLDPLDTTAKELYHALMVRADKDETALIAQFDGAQSLFLKELAKQFQTAVKAERAWVLKRSVVKKFLTTHQPSEVMRLLHYRSVASLLKNEQTEIVLALATRVETPQWHDKLRQMYHQLKAGDFEARPLKVLYYTADFENPFVLPISSVPELGVVVVVSSDGETAPGTIFTALSQCLSAYRHVKDASLLFKAHHVRTHPGWIVQEFLSPRHHHISIAGCVISWGDIAQSLRQYYGDVAQQLFDVVLDDTDLQLLSSNDLISKLAPELLFWPITADAAAVIGDQAVSLHIGDIGVDMLQKRSFDTRSTSIVRANVQRTILAGYAAQPALQRHILKQLDKIETQPQTKTISKKQTIKRQPAARKSKA